MLLLFLLKLLALCQRFYEQLVTYEPFSRDFIAGWVKMKIDFCTTAEISGTFCTHTQILECRFPSPRPGRGTEDVLMVPLQTANYNLLCTQKLQIQSQHILRKVAAS
jgi:hypothetical protein